MPGAWPAEPEAFLPPRPPRSSRSPFHGAWWPFAYKSVVHMAGTSEGADVKKGLRYSYQEHTTFFST